MRREVFEAALEAYQSLADGITDGDQEAILAARQLLRAWGNHPDSDVQLALVQAQQAAFLEWADGPLDDLLIGLNIARCLAKKYLKRT